MVQPYAAPTTSAPTTVASGNWTGSESGLGAVTGDLIIARIVYRGTANFTLPAGWSLCAQETSGNTIVNNSGGDSISSGLMAFIIRTGTAPSYVFTRTGGDVAQGYISRYPGPFAASPLGQTSSNTLAVASATLTAPGFTTTTDGELLVSMQADARAGVGGAFFAATDPVGVSGGAVTVIPDDRSWSARSGASTTTGADAGITIYDAVKSTAGPTGTFTTTETLSARHVVIAASFKNAGVDLTEQRLSKLTGYAVVSQLPENLEVSKLTGYAVVDSLPPNLEVSKLTGYAVIGVQPEVQASRIRAYVALTPSTNELVASRVRAYTALATSISELRVSRLRSYTALRPSPAGVGSATGTATVIGISPTVAAIRRRRATNVRFKVTTLLNSAGSATGTGTAIGIAVGGFAVGSAAGTCTVTGVGSSSTSGLEAVRWNETDQYSGEYPPGVYTFTSGGLTAARTSSNGSNRMIRGNTGKSSGKWYFEVRVDSNSASIFTWSIRIGVASLTALQYYALGDEPSAATWAYAQLGGNPTGAYVHNGSLSGTPANYGTSDIIGVHLDLDNGKIFFSKNGTVQSSGDPAAGTNPAFTGVSGTLYPAANMSTTVTEILTARFKASDQTYTPASGYLPWAGAASSVGAGAASGTGAASAVSGTGITSRAGTASGTGVAVAVSGAGIILEPGDDVAAIVSAAAVGDTFYFTAGTYRQQTIVPKNNQTFIGAAGAILNGSAVLTAWTLTSGKWQIGGQSQQGLVHPTAEFMPGTQRPGYPECVFRDNVPLVPVNSLANVVSGKFYLDYATDTLYIADNPSGHVIEASKKTDAFHGSATGVTIRNLIVEKYGPQIQDGAINAGVGWTVEDCETRLNYSVGISMRGNGGSIINCYSHDNGEMGLQGGSFSSGSLASGILVEGCRLARNGFWSFIDPLWEGGGCKFTNTDGLIFRDNEAYDNNGSGLWADINNVDTLYEDNVLSRNTINGISHEISYDAIIRNNTFWGNGFGDARGWGFGVDLNIQTSKNVEAYGNRIEATGGHNPLVMLQQNRGSGPLGTYECTGNYIHDNIVVNHDSTGSVGGFSDYNTSAMTGGGNVWQDNEYHMTDGSSRFEWGGNKTFSQFVTATGETGTRDVSYPDTSGWPTST